MPTVALLTDFGLRDSFAGIMKGVILSINPAACIVDLTHGIAPQAIDDAAFLLKSSYRYFPKKTIFLAVVDPGVGSARAALAIRSANYFFVGPDNGVLAPAAEADGIKKIVALENQRYFCAPLSQTFHGRDIFAPCAAHISKGASLGSFGPPLVSLKKSIQPAVRRDADRLGGAVVYVDGFGNLVTNIDRRTVRQFAPGGRVRIKIKNRAIPRVSSSYQGVPAGGVLAIFGSFGYLEISVHGGSAARLLRAGKGAPVTIGRG